MATSLEASLDRIRSDSGNNPIDVIEGLDTTLTFINNLIDHPDHQRYHRIRLSNLNFKERLGHLRHALSLLGAVGFGQDPTDHDFIAVDCRDEGSQSFVLRLRQFRVAIMTAKKEMQNKFWDFERLPNDHKWVSVKGAGCYELQGRRPHMEDDFVLLDCFAGQTSSGLFCCFDGHGGREAVEFCVRSFPLNLQREILKAKVNRDMHRLIESAFLVTDAQMRRRSILESGATAAICLVIMESEERVLYSANAGDARSVLVKCSEKVTGTRISFDHKPNSGDEIARINKAGGFVAGGRVNGILAVSRAFGDHHLKPSVSVEPYISRTVLEQDDAAIIIACDGVWDILSDQEASECVMGSLKNGESAQAASEVLAQHAFDRGSLDNITAIVIEL